MYGISTYIYPQNQPFMYVNIPVPWMVWDRGYDKPLQGSLYQKKHQILTNTSICQGTMASTP